MPARVHAVERRLDLAIRQQLLDEYLAGSPTTLLMERYSLGKGTVLGILRRAGVQLRNQGISDTELPRAIALYESGLSLKAVGDHFACDAETVRQALRSAGVLIPKPRERVGPGH